MFLVPCCGVCSDFRIHTLFGSFYSPVVCRRLDHVLFMLRCVCLRIVVSITYYVVYFALFFFVLCTQCCKFLWIVHSCLSLRFSLQFIYTNTDHTEGAKALVWKAFVCLMLQLSFHYLAIGWHLCRQLHTLLWVKTPVPRLITSTNNILFVVVVGVML